MAAAGDFHHLRTGGEAGFASKLGESPAHRRGGRLDDLAANIANEKHDRLLRGVPMAAGEKGVARREPMDKAVFK